MQSEPHQRSALTSPHPSTVYPARTGLDPSRNRIGDAPRSPLSSGSTTALHPAGTNLLHGWRVGLALEENVAVDNKRPIQESRGKGFARRRRAPRREWRWPPGWVCQWPPRNLRRPCRLDGDGDHNAAIACSSFARTWPAARFSSGLSIACMEATGSTAATSV